MVAMGVALGVPLVNTTHATRHAYRCAALPGLLGASQGSGVCGCGCGCVWLWLCVAVAVAVAVCSCSCVWL